MIKKAVFEDDLIYGMQRELQSYNKKQGMQNLDKAGDHLYSALEIFEQAGMTAQADAILKILAKIAQQAITPDEQNAQKGGHSHPKAKDPTKVKDPHTHGLTPEKMVQNYATIGIPFNLADDGKADDLLNSEVGNDQLEVNEAPVVHDFEEEVD